MTTAPEAKGVSVRMPAEWEPHTATHLAWPANCADWPGKFAAVRWAFVEFVRHIAATETVRLAVNTEKDELTARRMFADAHVNMDKVVFHRFALDRGWMRDISPCFVYTPSGERQCVRFRFNGWAKYDNHKMDARWAEEIAEALCLPITEACHARRTVVLEGGALDCNGQGVLLTTEECLLDQQCQVRNPGFTKKDYEACFQTYLGITQVIWLNRGICGDDTHGHVDDICRFVAPDTVVCCCEQDPRSQNYAALNENLERLQDVRLDGGGNLTCIALPMPAPLYFRDTLLPASYANFYIANDVVVVPTFNDVNDRAALRILAELFPDRRVLGIHAVDLVWGFGALHCLCHEEPAS